GSLPGSQLLGWVLSLGVAPLETQLQAMFEDIALYFTREEWELLSQPENTLVWGSYVCGMSYTILVATGD
uniref:KRAB domain-containing protein n=1 Tax=Chelonoidis abingdonii TaxID=106734 RepID=A0A8C0FYK2_CHEAB